MNWDFRPCTVSCSNCTICRSVNIRVLKSWPRMKTYMWSSYWVMTTYIIGNWRFRIIVAKCDTRPNYKVANITVLTVSSCRSDRQICTHIDKNKQQVNGSIGGLICWLEQIGRGIKLAIEGVKIININDDNNNNNNNTNNNHTQLSDAVGTASTETRVRLQDSVLCHTGLLGQFRARDSGTKIFRADNSPCSAD